MDKMQLSKHFTITDLCKSNTASRLRIEEQFNPPTEVINRLTTLCRHVLDPAKDRFPDLQITSGYRCKRLNAQLGGVANSQHIYGMAADITSKNLVDLLKWLEMRPFDQLIAYETFIHVSFDGVTNRNMIISPKT